MFSGAATSVLIELSLVEEENMSWIKGPESCRIRPSFIEGELSNFRRTCFGILRSLRPLHWSFPFGSVEKGILSLGCG